MEPAAAAVGRVLGEALAEACSAESARAIACWRPRARSVTASNFAGRVDLDALGGLAVNGLSREPIAGSPPPCLYETRAGMSLTRAAPARAATVTERMPALKDRQLRPGTQPAPIAAGAYLCTSFAI